MPSAMMRVEAFDVEGDHGAATAVYLFAAQQWMTHPILRSRNLW